MAEFKVGDRVKVNKRGHLFGSALKAWGESECSPGDEGVVTESSDSYLTTGNYMVTWDKNGRTSGIRPESLELVTEPVKDTFPRVIQSLDTWYAAYGLEPTHKVVPIDAVVTMPEPQQGAWQVQFQTLGTKDDALAIHDLVKDAVESAGLTLRGNTKVTVDNWIPSTEKVD